MIGTDSMRGDFHVKEADFTNQRLLPFVFTPGADDFHNAFSDRAKLMPNRFTQKTQKAEQKSVLGPSPREPCRAGSAAKTGVPQILRIHQVKTYRSQMHTDRDVSEHLSVTFTLEV